VLEPAREGGLTVSPTLSGLTGLAALHRVVSITHEALEAPHAAAEAAKPLNLRELAPLQAASAPPCVFLNSSQSVRARLAGEQTRPQGPTHLTNIMRGSMTPPITEEMAIGTTRYFPLGISTEDRWGAARRRRLLAICAVCALVAAGFAIVGKARLITMKPVDAGLRPATSESAVEPPGVWYKTERPDQTQVLTEAVIAPLAAPVSPSTAAQMDSTTGNTPALAPQPPSPPTILRGTVTKPR
jgi:hypothetical protein